MKKLLGILLLLGTINSVESTITKESLINKNNFDSYKKIKKFMQGGNKKKLSAEVDKLDKKMIKALNEQEKKEALVNIGNGLEKITKNGPEEKTIKQYLNKIRTHLTENQPDAKPAAPPVKKDKIEELAATPVKENPTAPAVQGKISAIKVAAIVFSLVLIGGGIWKRSWLNSTIYKIFKRTKKTEDIQLEDKKAVDNLDQEPEATEQTPPIEA